VRRHIAEYRDGLKLLGQISFEGEQRVLGNRTSKQLGCLPLAQDSAHRPSAVVGLPRTRYTVEQAH